MKKTILGIVVLLVSIIIFTLYFLILDLRNENLRIRIYCESNYLELKKAHDELVERLSKILPAGAYIEQEDTKFNLEEFKKDFNEPKGT